MKPQKYIATPSRTNAILSRYDLDAKKSLGQNFLMEPQILIDMIEAAGVDRETNVIEIGPGIGALTEMICLNAHQVLAYEVDQRLLPVLENELADFDNLTVKHQDILKADVATDIQEQFDPERPLAVVSNLPYYITTPIIFHLLEATDKIDTFALMMQSEVADRLTAEPGSKAYGSLTVIMNYYCEAHIAQRVPVTVFKPRPKVTSAILVLKRRQEPIVSVDNPAHFINMVYTAFAHRRKTLWNNLRSGLTDKAQEETLRTALEEATIDPKLRAERLSIQDFVTLANVTGKHQIAFLKR